MKLINFKIVALLFIILSLISCGKKSNPMPYGSAKVSRINDLKAEEKEEGFLLIWSVSKKERLRINHFIIERAKRLLNDNTCLLSYEILKEVDKNQTQFLDTDIQKGFLYNYKIKIVRNSGAISKSSNIVTKIKY